MSAPKPGDTKKVAFPAPPAGRAADVRALMDAASDPQLRARQEHAFAGGEVRERTRNAALLFHDDLEPAALAALERDDDAADRLALLREAEGWLHSQVRRRAPIVAGEHPPADELYDFGRGPGARPLALGRREAIDAHVETCAECAHAVRSLARRPPQPRLDESRAAERRSAAERAILERWCAKPAAPSLVAEPEFRVPPLGEAVRHRVAAAGHTAPAASPVTPAPRLLGERPRPDRVWATFAALAAAGVLALIAFQPRLARNAHAERLREEIARAESGFPSAPTLRGEAPALLAHPRGEVLARTSETPAWANGLDFVLSAPVAGASAYRFELFARTADIYAKGRSVLRLESAEPAARAKFAEIERLRPGRYTWSAWATVHGLDQKLGERDFELVEGQTGLWRAIAATCDDPRAVRWLEAQGFESDARRVALAQAPSPERDAYLRGIDADGR